MVEQVGHDVGAKVAELGQRGEPVRERAAGRQRTVDDELAIGETERAQKRALQFSHGDKFAADGSLNSGVIRQRGTQLRRDGRDSF